MSAQVGQPPHMTAVQKLAAVNEQTWLSMGKSHARKTRPDPIPSLIHDPLGALAELMTDYDRASNCYEQALRHNPYSIQALSQIASLCRGREHFQKVSFR
jgi:hypothetical protein